MMTRFQNPSLLLMVCALVCSAAVAAQAQTSFADLQKALNNQGGFNETDFAALQRGESVVKPASVQDKRVVAVAGLVSLRATAEEFLRSYRESLTKSSNAAVMEIGSFGAVPALADLQNLTLEAKDIEDLKACAVGECQIKLSAAMIERFAKEVNWQAPDYAQQATQLFRTMLFEYVTDYRARGDAALIHYGDKSTEVRLGEEHNALTAASVYLNDVFSAAGSGSELQPVEELIVWSKIKFGLKPVIAINHVTIYKRERELGPQVLAVSKQLYANHYFNASLALTAFVTLPGPTSYLVYENRSRADGLEGAFSKLKRSVIERKAVEGLKGILEHSKITLEAPILGRESTTLSASPAEGWGRRLFGGVRPLLWLLFISALIALVVLRNYEGRAARAAAVKRIEL
jgi:hypothetical protein